MGFGISSRFPASGATDLGGSNMLMLTLTGKSSAEKSGLKAPEPEHEWAEFNLPMASDLAILRDVVAKTAASEKSP